MRQYFYLFLGLSLVSADSASATRMPLLPRPQQARYGEGALPVNGLSIRFASTPVPEDRFAARELAARLSAISQSTVTIQETGASGSAILLRRTREGGPLPAANESAGPESRESYSIKVTATGAEICAPSSAGLFYGAQTLLQMTEGCGVQAVLPVAEIRDWPALAYRGFMMDFSHGQLLKVSEIERQIDLLARFKANQYYFYSEASIELEGYELVNPEARYSRDEVRHIIDYAKERHIDVVPCLELYGHMHDLFRLERFADLGLPRYGDEFDPRNPRVLAVLDNWVEQTAKLFPSPWYHVGFDEPWALGKIGTSSNVDPYKVYAEVLRHVAGEAQRHRKRLMFWADMLSGSAIFSKHPELIAQLPAETIAVPWVYDDRANYLPYIEPLARANVSTVVAPAIWNWNELFPDYHRSISNINGLTATGKKFKTLGVLNTGWTDSAQTIYRMSLPGLALGAAAGWQSEPVDARTFFNDYALQTYPADAAAEVASALEELSGAEVIFEAVFQGTTQHAFWSDPLEPGRLARLEGQQQELRKARLLAESAQERLQRARHINSDPTLKSLLLAARMFDYLGMKSLYAVEWSNYFRQLKENPKPELVTLFISVQINAQDHGMLADLMDAVSSLREQYREAWLEESTPYRLGSALARWDAERESWRAMNLRVSQLLRDRKKDQPFPSLETLRQKSP